MVQGIRWGALGLAVVAVTFGGRWQPANVVACLILVAYAGWRTVHPVRFVATGRRGWMGVLGELLVVLTAVAGTGFAASPFVLCLITAVVVVGFAAGIRPAVAAALGSAAVLASASLVAGHLAGLATSAQWGAELVLVGLLAGHARRLFGQVEQQHSLALDRVTKLSEANALLSSLHRVAQTLPASLDMNEVLTSTVTRLHDLIDFDLAALVLRDEATDTWSLAAGEGARASTSLKHEALPAPLRVAASGTGVWLEPRLSHDTGPGWDAFSRSGLYAPLLARGTLVGLLAVEHHDADHFGPRDRDVLAGLVEHVALAVDNARWFARLRNVGASEERSRIARELHDRLGQSLAYLGFQLDRVTRMDDAQQMQTELQQLRHDVRGVIGEVRETLYDLRTDVSEERGVAETLRSFAERVTQRSGIEVTVRHHGGARLPLRQERELWRIAQEAITNAERHSGAKRIDVGWDCDVLGALLVVSDDGRGFPEMGAGRSDSYGLLGMRERADAVGARLEVDSAPGQGTTVRCRLEQG